MQGESFDVSKQCVFPFFFFFHTFEHHFKTMKKIVDIYYNCLTNYVLFHFTPLVISLTNFESLKFKKDDLKF